MMLLHLRAVWIDAREGRELFCVSRHSSLAQTPPLAGYSIGEPWIWYLRPHGNGVDS